jgi:hypothetical protein
MEHKMNGQWLGQHSGTNTSGLIMINLDDMGDHYSGVAFLLANSNPPLSFKFNIFEIGSVNPQNMRLDTWDYVKQFFPALVGGLFQLPPVVVRVKTNNISR